MLIISVRIRDILSTVLAVNKVVNHPRLQRSRAEKGHKCDNVLKTVRLEALDQSLVNHLAKSFEEIDKNWDGEELHPRKSGVWLGDEGKNKLIPNAEIAIQSRDMSSLSGNRAEINILAEDLYPNIYPVLAVFWHEWWLKDWKAQNWILLFVDQVLTLCRSCWDFNLIRSLLEDDIIRCHLSSSLPLEGSVKEYLGNTLGSLISFLKISVLIPDNTIERLLNAQIGFFEEYGLKNIIYDVESFEDELHKIRSGLVKGTKIFGYRRAVINATYFGIITEEQGKKRLKKIVDKLHKKRLDVEESKKWAFYHASGYRAESKAEDLMNGADISDLKPTEYERKYIIEALIHLDRHGEALDFFREGNVTVEQIRDNGLDVLQKSPNRDLGEFLFYLCNSVKEQPRAVDIINTAYHTWGEGLTRMSSKYIEKIESILDDKIRVLWKGDAYELMERLTGKKLIDSRLNSGLLDIPTIAGKWLDLSQRRINEAGVFIPQYGDLIRTTENEARAALQIPAIGEGWVSETLLYKQIQEEFSSHYVVQHGRPQWLGRQHLDIYFPNENIGIEYQGIQHDEPVEIFGGNEGLRKTQERDRVKEKLCEANGCRLIMVYPDYSLGAVYTEIRTALKSQGA